MSQSCPKCGHVRPSACAAPAWQCPNCGIAYAKYRAGAAGAGDPAPPARSRGTDFGDVAMLTAALVVMMAFAKTWFARDVSPLNHLLLVPFYFCFVPVLTFAWRRELWIWNRYAVRFECLDFAARPWLGYLNLLFYAAASITFAGFFVVFDR